MVPLRSVFTSIFFSHGRSYGALDLGSRFRIIMSFFFLIFIWTVGTIHGFQDPIRFDHLTTEDGLSNSTVYAIFQDSLGFLWVGTSDGLNRYDGYSFTTYRHDKENPSTLGHNSVWVIFEDRSGTLWIGTNGGGLNRYDRDTDTFERFLHDSGDPHTLSHDSVMAIAEDTTGRLWVGTLHGLNCYDAEHNNFVRYMEEKKRPGRLKRDRVLALLIDESDHLWVGTLGSGLYSLDLANSDSYNPDRAFFTRFQGNSDFPDSYIPDRISAMTMDLSGIMWIATYGSGFIRMDPRTGEIINYEESGSGKDSCKSRILDIYADREGKIWVATNCAGLYRFNPETQRGDHVLAEPHRRGGLSADKIWSLFEDRLGNLWIGTEGEGLNVINQFKSRFHLFDHVPDDPTTLSHNFVTALIEDFEGRIWIATEEGLNTLDLETGMVTAFKDNHPLARSLNNYAIRHMELDAKGCLWFATDSQGVIRMDPEIPPGREGRYTQFLEDKNNLNSLNDNRVWVIHEDSKGAFWFGTRYGLSSYDPRTGDFVHYNAEKENPAYLSHNFIISVAEEADGTLWFGTFGGGLNRFNRREGTFSHFQHDGSDPTSLSDNHIECIHIDSKGFLWIGTWGGGVNRLNTVTGTCSHYSTKSGLPSDVIWGILEASDDQLWISTNKGLSRFNPSTEIFTNFDRRDGLPGNEFSQNAYLQTRDGVMWFGGREGLCAFRPESIQPNQHKPQIVISGFQILNKPVEIGEDSALKKTIWTTEEISLTYRDHLFSFEFASLDFTVPEKNRYAYKMEGFDRAWNEVGTRRHATYTNLPAGNYIFRVRGSNNDGIWNEKGASVQIHMTPPPWKSWWAYTLYTMMLLGALLWYVRIKTKAQAKELARQRYDLEQERNVTERLRQVDRLKDEFLANTSHELRTPLHGIIGIAESLHDGAAGTPSREIQENLSMIVSSGRRLANLVNDILDFSRLKTHDLELTLKAVNMRVLTDILIRLLTPLTMGKSLDLVNEIPWDVPLVHGDENRLQQIMSNLIGNGIKFTESGSVTVFARVIDGAVELNVTDTGIGIPEEKLDVIFHSFEQADASTERVYGGTGLGLAITRNLVKLHGGTISVVSEVGRGSTFTITLPTTGEQVAQPPGEDGVSKIRSCTDTESLIVEEPSRAQPEGDYSVLIVDDEPINQKVLSNHLSMANYSITQAMNGEEALGILEKGRRFDMILLDVMMPRMSGYEVCQKIRETYLPSELPVIMITAKNQVADLVEGFSSGANDYIAKPFTKNELLARIKTHLNLHNINIAFGRFVPQEFLRTLGRDSIVDVRLGDQIQGDMTVLFSDIRSFSTISEGMTPGENFDFLNDYLRQVIPTIRENEGFIDKYIGDAIMAIFPRLPDHAIRASVDALQRLRTYNADREREGIFPIHIGTGIHTGPLMLGTIGDEERMDGTVISDAVNLASRLEGLTKIYGASIVMSNATLDMMENPDPFDIRSLGKVRVKGKSEPVGIYEVLDGGPDKTRELKLETMNDYEEGMILFMSGEFERACDTFSRVLKIHPGDTAAALFFDSSTRLKERERPEGWDGTITMESK